MNPGTMTNDPGTTTSTGAPGHLPQAQAGQDVATSPHIQASCHFSEWISDCNHDIDRRGIPSRLAVTCIPPPYTTTTTAFSSATPTTL